MLRRGASKKPRHSVLDYFIETEAAFQCLVELEVGSVNDNSSEDGKGDVPEGSGGSKLCDQIYWRGSIKLNYVPQIQQTILL